MRLAYTFIILICLMASCACSKSATAGGGIPYEEASNYFLRNDVTTAPPAVIASQAEFDRYFGMAAVMGANGKPTSIDFAKQNVIAVAVPSTQRNTTIQPINLSLNAEGKMELQYKIIEKEQLSFTMSPIMLLVVDKKYGSDVVLKRE